MQEGMCKNCGSIVYVDPKQDNCHCLFCDCVFPTEEALDIIRHPEDFEFPNEEQPEYTGEEINPQQSKINANLNQQVEKREKKAKAKAKPKYAVESKQLPDINLTKKQILSVVAIVAVIAGLFLLITLPQTIRRDNQRVEITDRLKTELSEQSYNEALDFNEGFAISRIRNSYVDIISAGDLSKEDAVDIFETYCKTRADVMNIDLNETNKAYNDVVLRISMAGEGGFLIKDQDLSDLANLDSITELP